MRYAVGTGIAARDHLHTHRMSFHQALRVRVENLLQVPDDLRVPAHPVRVIHLHLHGRKRRHPRNLLVAHPRQLIVANKKTVLDRIHAAVDHMIDAGVTGCMRQRLLAKVLCRCDKLADLARPTFAAQMSPRLS